MPQDNLQMNNNKKKNTVAAARGSWDLQCSTANWQQGLSGLSTLPTQEVKPKLLCLRKLTGDSESLI